MGLIDSELTSLRDLLLKLKPTGENGFEGLLAAALTDVTRMNYRIARSGSQQGKDGQSTDAAVKFEAKLYGDDISKNDVLNKIAEIGTYDDGRTDLWVLGSTGVVPTQVADLVEKLGRKLTIGTLILDWPSAGLPPLATLLVMAKEVTASFLAENVGADESSLDDGLEAIALHPHYGDRESELRLRLSQPDISPTIAIQANRIWLRSAFENRSRARSIFGQPLSPADTSLAGILDRPALHQRFGAEIFQAPSGSIAALLGADGNGKSWLFAQTWLSEPNPPLTIMLLPNDFSTQVSPEKLEELILSKLITQTNDSATDAAKFRWGNLFAHWRSLPTPSQPRVLVFVDGINQRQNLPWNRILDLLNELVVGVGGSLAISCRTFFFRDHLKGRLVGSVRETDVPEWTQQELEQLLTDRGISISRLAPGVAASLRNPRVLAIALELLNTAQIEQIEELSVSRLLFEHIRSSDNGPTMVVPPHEFVRTIRDHAEVIINRLYDSRLPDDLTIFDRRSNEQSGMSASLTQQFDAVAAGRFFEPLEAEPSFYKLREDGLPLALGLSLVSSTQRAYRNGHTMAEELARILDPIASLDKTSDILLSAVVVACLDERSGDAVAAALIQAFIQVQNPDSARYPEFRALARHSPSPFLIALEDTTLSDRQASTLSWLTDALFEIRTEPGAFALFSPFLQRWLNMYSEAPDRSVFARKEDDPKKYADESETKKVRLEERIGSFSEGEKAILAELHREERGDYMSVCRIALQLLAGMPLKAYARQLRNWRFSDALNGGHTSPTRMFATLITFNTIDWVETREALLCEIAPLKGAGVSSTGKWALVGLLYATGALEDAKEAAVIVEELTKDQERGWSWRRIEDYCETDPCAPDSCCPENINGTVERYANVALHEIRNAMGLGMEDDFFEEARVGLARFRPEAAVSGIRKLADNVLLREGIPLRFGIFLLEKHTLALDDETAKKFVEKSARLVSQALEEGSYKDHWVTGQFALKIAFPHMTGNEQLIALLNHPRDKDMLLNLLNTLQTCDADLYDAALAKAFRDGDEILQMRLMAFGQYTKVSPSDESKEIVTKLIASPDKIVRICALGLIRRLGDRRLLEAVVASHWSASELDKRDDRYEIWYGSHILVKACLEGLISDEECLQRIGMNAFPAFAKARGLDGVMAVAQRLDAAIAKASGYRTSIALPEIELNSDCTSRPPAFEVNEKIIPNSSPLDAFRRMTEGEEKWEERQKRAAEAFLNFERELTRADADVILETVQAEFVEEIARAHRGIVEGWCKKLLNLDLNGLMLMHNVAALVAQAISQWDATLAVALFSKLDGVDPVIRRGVGRARVALSAVAIWGAGDSPGINELRFGRLDRASTDKVLADEAWAASRAGKEALLEEYVRSRHLRPEPTYQARAIMVAGFSEGQTWAVEALKQYGATYGFLADARNAAKFALDRHLWSQHWAKLMTSATIETEMWRYGVILAKIVDARFRNPHPDCAPESLLARYGDGLEQMLKERIKKWSDKRSKKLFGLDAPDEIYIN